MTEKKRTFSIPIGKSAGVFIASGTKMIQQIDVDPDADIILDFTVTEITED